MVSICAVIAVRNEAHCLRVLLPRLARQNIDVVILDNGSTDGSLELYSSLRDRPLLMVEHLPYQGSFTLLGQLHAKQAIYGRLRHDWVIHHDADEVMEGQSPGQTLREAIEAAEASGCNALNFDEFVFLPEANADHFGRDYPAEILRYYFFEPRTNRLNRAWKRSLHPNGLLSGGHNIDGVSLSFFPGNQILRHYIVLSEAHARQKYLHRTFSEQEARQGWHRNRLNLTDEMLRLPHDSPYLFRLPAGEAKSFRTDRPSPTHYWEWSAASID